MAGWSWYTVVTNCLLYPVFRKLHSAKKKLWIWNDYMYVMIHYILKQNRIKIKDKTNFQHFYGIVHVLPWICQRSQNTIIFAQLFESAIKLLSTADRITSRTFHKFAATLILYDLRLTLDTTPRYCVIVIELILLVCDTVSIGIGWTFELPTEPILIALTL